MLILAGNGYVANRELLLMHVVYIGYYAKESFILVLDNFVQRAICYSIGKGGLLSMIH